MSADDRDYTNGTINVHWRPALCEKCHACVEALPSVFNPENRPWVDLSRVPTEYLRRHLKCPSGALTISDAKTDPRCGEDLEA